VPLSPGRYRVSVRAEGYAPVSRAIEVKEGDSTTSIELRLQRHGSLAGRVVDGGTQDPVAGIGISASKVAYFRGRKSLLPMKGGVTDTNGSFRIEGLPPGEYFVEIGPQRREAIIERSTRKASLEADTKIYRRTIYPLSGLDTAGVVLFSGAELYLGEIVLTKEPIFRIGVKTLADCEQGDRLNVSLSERFEGMLWTRGSAQFPCRSEIAALNLSPGKYHLAAWIPGRLARERLSAHSETTVFKDDVDVALSLLRPIPIRGKITITPNGMQPAGDDSVKLPGLRISLARVDGLPFGD
jgi:hypothetical protein